MGRARTGRGARGAPLAPGALLALGALLAAATPGGALAQPSAPAPLGAAAEECAPLPKKPCKKSERCRWGGRGARCAAAKDACDAVQGKKLRKKCARVPAMRCQCSKKPEKKRGKCGTCAATSPPTSPAPTPAPPTSCVKSGVASLGAPPTGTNATEVWKEVWNNLQDGDFTGLMLDYMAKDPQPKLPQPWDIVAGLRLRDGSAPQLIASATQDCGLAMNATRLLDKWNKYGSGSKSSNPWVALAFDTTNAQTCGQTGDPDFCSRLDKAIRLATSTSGNFKDQKVPMFYNVEKDAIGNKSCNAWFEELKRDGFKVRSIGDAYSTGNTAAIDPCTDVVQTNPCLMHSLNQTNGSQTVWGKCPGTAAFSYFDAFWMDKNEQRVGAFPCTPDGARVGRKVICSKECADYINKFKPNFSKKPPICFF